MLAGPGLGGAVSGLIGPGLGSALSGLLAAGVVQRKITRLRVKVAVQSVVAFLGIGLLTMLYTASFFYFQELRGPVMAALGVAAELTGTILLILAGYGLWIRRS